MSDPEDIVEIEGVHWPRPGDAPEPPGPRARWLSIWFQCCHVYGRINRNQEGTKYEGRCPRCGARVQALIGEGGTNQRMFRAS